MDVRIYDGKGEMRRRVLAMRGRSLRMTIAGEFLSHGA
jgi:hypothetical protein